MAETRRKAPFQQAALTALPTMNIGINTLFLIPGEVGGTETYLRETLRVMVANHPEVIFTLFTNHENDAYWKRELGIYQNVAFSPLGFAATNRVVRILNEQFRLPIKARKANLDILWSPGYTAPAVAPCPQVVTIHDMQYKAHPDDLTFSYRMATDILVRLAARQCRGTLTISEFSKKEILRYTSAKPDAVVPILLAADPDFAIPLSPEDKRTTREALSNIQKPYILAVSNSYPHKNLHALTEAFAQLERAIPHQLVLAGRPRLGEPRLEKALENVNDASRVVRLAYLEKPALKTLYQNADVFVMPSLYEGFGLPVLEAMMAGTPVVTTRRASLPELGGDCVDYFDPDKPGDLAETLRTVLARSAGTRTARIQAARTRAQTFSWHRTAEDILAALRKWAKKK